ncbi:MAG: Na/Pi cotransporter family protein, partial [Clostridia bacterium]|nr:Na/Pi cotransporter family protein [Clostridia bacterium]
MDIFSILTLCGGLALFLFGMDYMGDGLKKLSGSQLESILGRLTSNRFKGFLLGLGVTAIIQSSSATTVMLVGFVNSGIMNLTQTIGTIMGANVGTTVTAWLISTTGITSDLWWLRLFKPESFTPILAVAGVIMIMMSKSEKKKNLGSIFVGFAVLMFGMESMSGAMEGLKDDPNFARILVMFENPILGILAGTLLTAIIQSSSASVGILQALSLTGAIPMSTAIPVVLGQNIGTTITPILASLSASRDSKRVAISCLYIKIIGVVIFTVVFYAINAVVPFGFMSGKASVFSIALFHTLFNILSTVILIPFCEQFEKLAVWTFKGEDEEKNDLSVLDDNFLSMPGFALEKAKESIAEMIKIAGESVNISIDKLFDYDEKTDAYIKEQEERVDNYEDKLGSYLVKLAGHKLAMEEANEVTTLLHVIGDIERISDHACNILKTGKEIYEKNISFSNMARHEIDVITKAVKEIIELSIKTVA